MNYFDLINLGAILLFSAIVYFLPERKKRRENNSVSYAASMYAKILELTRCAVTDQDFATVKLLTEYLVQDVMRGYRARSRERTRARLQEALYMRRFILKREASLV
jgi:hypothetical protein